MPLDRVFLTASVKTIVNQDLLPQSNVNNDIDARLQLVMNRICI